jgi:hypothetical protein
MSWLHCDPKITVGLESKVRQTLECLPTGQYNHLCSECTYQWWREIHIYLWKQKERTSRNMKCILQRRQTINTLSLFTTRWAVVNVNKTPMKSFPSYSFRTLTNSTLIMKGHFRVKHKTLELKMINIKFYIAKMTKI